METMSISVNGESCTVLCKCVLRDVMHQFGGRLVLSACKRCCAMPATKLSLAAKTKCETKIVTRQNKRLMGCSMAINRFETNYAIT